MRKDERSEMDIDVIARGRAETARPARFFQIDQIEITRLLLLLLLLLLYTVGVSVDFGEGLKREGEAEVGGGEADVAEQRRDDQIRPVLGVERQQRVDLVHDVAQFVISVRRRQFQLQNQSAWGRKMVKAGD